MNRATWLQDREKLPTRQRDGRRVLPRSSSSRGEAPALPDARSLDEFSFCMLRNVQYSDCSDRHQRNRRPPGVVADQ